ncbi:NAD(P)-binding domain-containing protein [Paramicrosporidium saccamoebae]|uniref:NAD(P)-binding domain-containing protein n=1 Tax=Paramicrosporidium saccamoebae TaxID=1246581 RepID=A0A2H9TG20_9FUNG|nr:NAD(P)-binding domain-containing protein [Paramicrosporidium saccamoebae]
MTAKKVFVTGAGGQTGTQTLKWLNQVGENMEVYAGIHKGQESRQEDVVKSFKCCPCVTEGADHKQLVDCFRDVQDLFIVPPSTDDKREVACNYIKAAREANVKFVLLLSVQGADGASHSWGAPFNQIERDLKETGSTDWCIIRVPFYMQNLMLYKQQIKQGHLPLPLKEGKFAPIDVADVGKLAAWILKDCAPHKGMTYNITGTEALDGKQMAKVFEKFCAREVLYKDIPAEEARTILKSQNVPEVEIKALLDFYALAQENTFEKVTEEFKDICGTPPKSLQDWVSEHKSECM